MDHIVKRNPLTGLTTKEALANLQRKGYFNDNYNEADHPEDPDVLTIVTMRCQVATNDFKHANRIHYSKTVDPLLTHLPKKTWTKTMSAINHMMQENLKKKLQALREQRLQDAKNTHQSSDSVQLSLFDVVDNIPSYIDEQLFKLERYQTYTLTAYVNGELTDTQFKLFSSYFKQLEDYYKGERTTKPKLTDQHSLHLLSEIKDYHFPKTN